MEVNEPAMKALESVTFHLKCSDDYYLIFTVNHLDGLILSIKQLNASLSEIYLASMRVQNHKNIYFTTQLLCFQSFSV